MRQEADFFGDDELELVFMARRLREALKLEGIFTDTGVNYLVETGTYTGGFLFKRDLTGAFFYVAPRDTERAKAVITENRMKPYQADGSNDPREG